MRQAFAARLAGGCLRQARNALSYPSHITVQLVTNFAENQKSQISFTSLDSSKVTPVQPAFVGKTVLGKPE
jgi:hypothetical protein